MRYMINQGKCRFPGNSEKNPNPFIHNDMNKRIDEHGRYFFNNGLLQNKDHVRDITEFGKDFVI